MNIICANCAVEMCKSNGAFYCQICGLEYSDPLEAATEDEVYMVCPACGESDFEVSLQNDYVCRKCGETFRQ